MHICCSSFRIYFETVKEPATLTCPAAALRKESPLMNQKIYTANQDLALAEYCPAIDCSDHYACWQDPDTQNGYNYQMPYSPEEFRNRPIRSRFLAVIIRNEDNASLGIVSLSPEGSPPDLAIMLYSRGKGYGPQCICACCQILP